MGLSRRGAKFIERFEGFRASSYPDPATGGEPYTIGCGHTKNVGPRTGHPPWDRPWSRFKARRVLRKDAAPLDDLIVPLFRKGFKRKPRKHELDMLISLGFNLGPGIFIPGSSVGDSIRSAIAKGNRKAVARAFKLYDHAAGRRMEGLTRRRRAEADIFLKGYSRKRR